MRIPIRLLHFLYCNFIEYILLKNETTNHPSWMHAEELPMLKKKYL